MDDKSWSKHAALAGLAAVLNLAALMPVAFADHEKRAAKLPEIIIIGSSRRDEFTDVTPGASAAPAPDSMGIIARLPGAAINRNGPLSGQAQYRGLYGPRMTVLVNNMRVTPGGLNWMDSPMHYMPPGLTEKITMTRGIASVSSGTGIGGLIEAQSKRSEFTPDSTFEIMGDTVLSTMSNDGSALSAMLGAGNNQHRFHVVGSYEDGDDIESGSGTIGASEHERTTYGLGYGFQWSDSDFSIDYSHTDTDPTGTPALPLDIAFFETDRINIGYRTERDGIGFSAQVFVTDIEHGMDNFTLRLPPDNSMLPLPPFVGTERRTVDVESDAVGFTFKVDFDAGGGNVALGVDGNMEEHTGTVRDPDVPPFFVQNFNNAAEDRFGLFGEWLGPVGEDWFMEFGVRYNRVESDSDEVNAQPAQLCDSGMFMPGTPPCAVAVLRDRLNNSDRSLVEDNFDVVLKFDYRLSDAMTLGFGYARKTRAPSYIERYLWIPLEINSGLGDLNNYVGNIDLDSEVSDQLEFGLEWNFGRGYFSPRVFYRTVDDYIQGVPSMDMVVNAVSGAANGDPTPLVFANTDADFYGFDAPFRYMISDNIVFDATINYVRGKNEDLNDDLFRIAPLNGRWAVTFNAENWSATVENVLAAEQDKISNTIVINEPRSSNADTPGYGVVNVYAQWSADNGIQLRAGVENIFDKNYVNHVAGFNRIINSDVSFGDRLPGSGVNVYGQVAYAW